MRASFRRAGVAGIAVLLLMSGGLMGCGGSGSSTSGDADSSRLFDEISPSRLAEYTPSDVSYDTVYAPRDVGTMPILEGGMRKLNGSIDYPKSALRKGITGRVWIGFIVAPNGETTHVRIVDSAHLTLDQEALSTVTRANFTPGTMGDTPVPVKGVVPLTFKLRSPPAPSSPPND